MTRAARDESRPPATAPASSAAVTAGYWALRAFVIVALASACYLAWVSLRGGESMIGCAGLPHFDCEHVITSRWAYWFALPVSIAAVGVYATMLLASLLIGDRRSARVRRAASGVLVLTALWAAGAGLWFIGLLVFVSEKMCLWCLVVHICGLCAAALILSGILVYHWKVSQRPWLPAVQMIRNGPAPGERRHEFLAPVAYRRLIVAGLAGLAILIVGQILSPPPPKYRIEQFRQITQQGRITPDSELSVIPDPLPPEAPASSVEPAEPQAEPPRPPANPEPPLLPPEPDFPAPPTPGAAAEPSPTPAEPTGYKRVLILGGSAVLDTRAYPIFGKADAEYIVVDMSDYSCKHCRKLHHLLQDARKRYGRQFAVIFLPVPLNTACNKFVEYTHEDHRYACQYARLAVAVWRLDRDKFRTFHHWLYQPERPPPVSRARQYAAELVGRQALTQELRDPAVDETIRHYTRLFKLARAGAIPKLLFGEYVVSGEIESPQRLFDLLEQHMGIRPM